MDAGGRAMQGAIAELCARQEMPLGCDVEA